MPVPPFLSLGAALASEQDRLLGDRRLREIDLLPDRPRSRWEAIPRRARVLLLLLGLFIATTATLVVLAWKIPTLRYTVTGSASAAPSHDRLGRWFVASAREPTLLRFSDGSRAEAQPESRFRVIGTSRLGATFVLESGRLALSVAGSHLSEYLVGAGPFALTTSRSSVEVSWDPMTSSLVVFVKQGQPVLAGCQFGTGQSLAPATRLDVRCDAREDVR